MNIEEEIYNKLVEQFGIGEVCIKPHTLSKRSQLTWLKFIEAALKMDAAQLYNFCGFKPDGSSFSRYFRREYKELMLRKSKTTWKQFLPSILDYKICSKCRSFKEKTEFTYRKHTADNLTYICKTCEQEYRLANVEYYHNKDKERRNLLHSSILLQKKIYYTENKVKYRFWDAKRRAAKLQATPKWADLEAIKEIYKNCPEGYHVDHEIPLQGELVCGLHVHKNLKPIPAAENLAKGNKFEIN